MFQIFRSLQVYNKATATFMFRYLKVCMLFLPCCAHHSYQVLVHSSIYAIQLPLEWVALSVQPVSEEMGDAEIAQPS